MKFGQSVLRNTKYVSTNIPLRGILYHRRSKIKTFRNSQAIIRRRILSVYLIPHSKASFPFVEETDSEMLIKNTRKTYFLEERNNTSTHKAKRQYLLNVMS